MTSTLVPPAESQEATEPTEAQHVAPPPDDWENASWRDRLNLRKIVAPESVTPLAILFGLNAVDELDRTAFSVLTPEIKRAFGLSCPK